MHSYLLAKFHRIIHYPNTALFWWTFCFIIVTAWGVNLGAPSRATAQQKTATQSVIQGKAGAEQSAETNFTRKRTDEVADIKQVMEQWVRFWNVKDVNGIMKLVHADARMMYGGSNPKMATYKEYADILPERMKMVGNLVLTRLDIQIRDRATLKCIQDTPVGNLPLTFILKKDNSDWKIIRFEYEIFPWKSSNLEVLSQFSPPEISDSSHAEIVIIEANPRGETHFVTKKVRWIYWFNNGRRTPETPVTCLKFYHLRKELNLGLHPAPRKQYLLVLQGTLQIEVSTGEKRQFSPGSILLVADIAGTRGHKSSVIGTKDVFAAVMPLPMSEQDISN